MITRDEVEMLLRLAGWAILRHHQRDYHLGMAVSRIEVAGDPNTEYGYTPISLARSRPTGAEIGLMDKASEWLSYIPDDLVRVRKVVALRMLWDEERGRCIHSYKKVSKMVHTSPHVVREEYQRGLGIITARLQQINLSFINFPLYRIASPGA